MESSPKIYQTTSSGVDGLVEGDAGGGEVFCESSDVDAEEVVTSKKFPDPRMPSPEEVAAHRIDHLPYRSWCKWCIMGRALGEQHKSREEISIIPVIGVDYFFLTSKGIESIEGMGYSRGESGKNSCRAARGRRCGSEVPYR